VRSGGCNHGVGDVDDAGGVTCAPGSGGGKKAPAAPHWISGANAEPGGTADFPGGNVDEMVRSLQKLSHLSGDPTVFPGHWYSAEPSATLEDVKRTNYVYRASNLEQWRALMGARVTSSPDTS
jgi:hypothetical protein